MLQVNSKAGAGFPLVGTGMEIVQWRLPHLGLEVPVVMSGAGILSPMCVVMCEI